MIKFESQMCFSHSFNFENNLRENHVFYVLHNLRNSVRYRPQNARKSVSRIVVFKIFLWEHASGSPYHMERAYTSYETPGTRPPPPIFHEVSSTVGKSLTVMIKWNLGLTIVSCKDVLKFVREKQPHFEATRYPYPRYH